MAITTMTKNTDPINGTTKEKDPHLYDYDKVVHSKDDMKGVNRGLRRLNYKITGKDAFDENGNHKGFKCSAKCRPEVAEGHNRRNENWVKKLDHVAKNGDYEIWMDYKNLDSAYKEIFGEALEEYNKTQRSNRRIKNYLAHIQNDKRQGSMKKSAKVDNSRKPYYEFIFQIGRRDNRLDTESSKKILKEFCLEIMPKRFPNIRPIGIYLHADEATNDAVTDDRLQGAVHVHFVYVPIAHALSKEEQEEEKKWKKELEEKARKEAASKGNKFDKAKFDAHDWQLMRAKKFGKAIGNGMKLQSSLTGACCEMGFRTKGKLTAQIQMEEAVRKDLMDLVESYGIKVDRTIDTDRDEVVSIQEYKKREDNKAVLKETQKLYEASQMNLRRSEVLNEATEEKEEALAQREKNVSGLEKQKEAVEAMAAEVQKDKEKVAPYIERIDNLVEDEKTVQLRKTELNEQAAFQNQRDIDFERISNAKEADIASRQKSAAEKETSLGTWESDLKNMASTVEKDKTQNAEVAKLNEENAAINERNAKEIADKFDDFHKVEAKYKVYSSTVNENEQIKINVEDIGRQLRSDLLDADGSWRDKVDYAVTNFTERCQKVVTKLHDAVLGFKTFLQGKSSEDFRKLANDMDRNGTKSFEEYASKWANDSLDWQIEQRQRQLQLKSHRRSVDIER